MTGKGSFYAPFSFFIDLCLLLLRRYNPNSKPLHTMRGFFVCKSEINMGFSSGFLHDKITVQNRKAAEMGVYGVDSTGAEWEDVACLHANVGWQKGTSAMREGALDAYDTVLIRMRWNNIVTRESRLECDGRTYQIQSLHADRQDNIIQITATEVITK